MYKQKLILLIIIIAVLILTSCQQLLKKNNTITAGMLIETSIKDQPWDIKGYEGLKAIEKTYQADIYYHENVQTEQQVIDAVDDLVNKGVNLIFGHSNIYGKYFINIAQYYPDVHFVYFNGNYQSDNLTSINFDSHAMGFFGGMVAGKMTNTNEIGIIAAYEWQPEVEGFYEGAKYQNHKANVRITFINNWHDEDVALDMYETMRNNGVDVFYPTGDLYSESIIKQVAKDRLYAIGYVSDQSYISEEAVLTSTVQYVDTLYTLIAGYFEKGKLTGGSMSFDFKDGAIALGEFSPHVPEEFRQNIEEAVEHYIATDNLPYD